MSQITLDGSASIENSGQTALVLRRRRRRRKRIKETGFLTY
jgi:hypothetical protein